MKLKELRDQKKITQIQLCEKIGLVQQYYSRYENKPEKTPIQVLINLANFYNVSLDFLCGRQWNNQIGYIPEERKELIQLLIDLNETDFKQVESFIKGYIAGKSNSTEFKIFKD